jgi:hypothetical protein
VLGGCCQILSAHRFNEGVDVSFFLAMTTDCYNTNSVKSLNVLDLRSSNLAK